MITGRMRSAEPVQQTIPFNTSGVKPLRPCSNSVIQGQMFQGLHGFDFKEIEERVVASLSKKELAKFKRSLDP